MHWWYKPFMRHVINAFIAILIGFGLTLIFYMAGGPFVQPALFLAKLVATDRGGNTLLPAFLIINTSLCSILIDLGLCWATKRVES